MSPHCDLDLQDSKHIFPQDTLANDAASPYQVWLENVPKFWRYHPDKHSLILLTVAVTLTLNAVIWFFSQDQTKFGCKQTNIWEDIVEIVIFFISPHCDLDTEDSEPILLHDTLPHDKIPPYQVWLKMVEQFRRYPDKIQHMDRTNRQDGESDSNIYSPNPTPIQEGGGGGIIKWSVRLKKISRVWYKPWTLFVLSS